MGKKLTEDERFYKDMYAYTKGQIRKHNIDYRIDPKLYDKFNVKKGLRDKNGDGVIAGLTNISMIKAKEMVDGTAVPCDGQLLYRGYDIYDIMKRQLKKGGFGYEETAYLLLFGDLPSEEEFERFRQIIAANRRLPTNFVRDVIMKAPSADIMNSLMRSVLTLASYDNNAADISLENVLRQSLMLISLLPILSVYGYHAYNHYECDESMYIHRPDDSISFAGNLLRLLRPDKAFTELEERTLDAALILHMEHGGGNNSTFTNRVVTSSGSDTYAVTAAALASLKGPRHGGANIKVMEMMDDIRLNVKDHKDDEEIKAYLEKLVAGEAFDRSGLIYGVGHAVYSKSDPRAVVLDRYAEALAGEKKMGEDYLFYKKIADFAPDVISGRRKMYKGVSVNVDFYSGFVYQMLNIPIELYTSIFAIARMTGWTAHRIEELAGNGKIIRPAYKSLVKKKDI